MNIKTEVHKVMIRTCLAIWAVILSFFRFVGFKGSRKNYFKFSRSPSFFASAIKSTCHA